MEHLSTNAQMQPNWWHFRTMVVIECHATFPWMKRVAWKISGDFRVAFRTILTATGCELWSLGFAVILNISSSHTRYPRNAGDVVLSIHFDEVAVLAKPSRKSAKISVETSSPGLDVLTHFTASRSASDRILCSLWVYIFGLCCYAGPLTWMLLLFCEHWQVQYRTQVW